MSYLEKSSGKYKKLKFHWQSLSKKQIRSAKTLYADDLCNLLSTTCLKIHQIAYAIFETINHISHNKSFVLF